MINNIENKLSVPLYVKIIPVILAAGILISGYFYYGYIQRSYKNEIVRFISAIADLKVQQISRWQKERLTYADNFHNNNTFSILVKTNFDHPENHRAKKDLKIWLNEINEDVNLDDVILLDTNGNQRISYHNDKLSITKYVKEKVAEAIRTGEIIFVDFYKSTDSSKIFLGVLTPLYINSYENNSGRKAIGAIYLRIDPNTILYPYIKQWPTESKTSETLLIRRDGNEAVFLNQIRIDSNSSLNIRIPLDSKKGIPEIKAALGEEGIIEATDFNNMRTIAAIRNVPGTPWSMVASIEQSEAYEPLRERLWVLAFIVSVLLVVIGTGFGYIWKQQRVRFYQQIIIQDEAIRKSEETLNLVINANNDGIWDWDIIKDKEFLSQRYCEIIGYSTDDRNLPNNYNKWKSLIHPEDADDVVKALNENLKNGGVLDVEYRYLHKSGEYIWLKSVGKSIFDDNGNPVRMVGSIRDITERKKSEDALIQSESSLRLSQQIAKMGDWEWDLVSQKTKWSENTYNLYGLKPYEIDPSFENFKCRIHPDDWHLIEEGFEEIRKNKAPFEMIFRIFLPDGSLKWLLNKAIPILKDERLIKLKGVNIDITDYKRAEEQMMLQGTALNAVANAIVITDVSGCITWANPAFTELTGFTINEVIGKNPKIFKSGKHNKAFYKDMWETILSGKVWRGETINRRKDKSIYSEEMTITPLIDSKGNIIHFIAIKQDITERKQREQEIEQLQKQIDYIFGATKTGLSIVDIGYNLHYVSPGFQEIYGDFSGKKCYKYFKGLDEVCSDCLIKDAFESESIVVYESNFPFENNRPVQMTAIPFIGKDGKWLAAEVSADITERKKFENEILLAKESADMANKAKSSFLANMSHEIRTPMNTVLGFSELLNDLVVSPKAKNYLNAIQTSGKTLLKLINDLLDLSKIEAGMLEINRDLIDIKQVVYEIKQIFSLKIQEKGLDFIIDIDENIPSLLYIDELRIRQVLLNLVGNAVKFTEQGFIKIAVSYLHDNEQKDALIVSVEDSGIGIHEDSRDKVFDAFQQQDMQDARKFGGTGLGLSISSRLASLMNGRILLKSKPGEGSKFTLIINDVKRGGEKFIEKNPVNDNDEIIVFEPATILIVDDSESNRELIKGYFEEFKFSVLEADNGIKALLIAEEKKPDVILMDLRMPEMDGYEATEKIKANKVLSHIPIIILTAFYLETDEKPYFKDIIGGYLNKPVTKSNLIKELKKFLKFSVTIKEFSKLDSTEISKDNRFIIESNVLHILNYELMNEWFELQKRKPQEKLKSFCKKLIDIGNENNIEIIAEYGNNLMNSVNLFDINNINLILKEYPKIIKKFV